MASYPDAVESAKPFLFGGCSASVFFPKQYVHPRSSNQAGLQSESVIGNIISENFTC